MNKPIKQINSLNYDQQSARDGKRNNTGIAYSRAFDLQFTPSFYVSAYSGNEDVSNTSVEYLSYQFKGLRLGSSLRLMDNLSTNLQLSQEKREHNDGLYPLLNLNRTDTEKNVNLSANWRINKHFSLIPSYNYSDNQSNIAFSDFTRHVISIDLRVDM